MDKNKESYTEVGTVKKLLASLMEENEYNAFSLSRTEYSENRNSITRIINEKINDWLGEKIKNNQLYVEFISSQNITGHAYPYDKKLEVSSLSMSSPSNGGWIEEIIDGQPRIKYVITSSRPKFRLNYIDEAGFDVNNGNSFEASECLFYFKRLQDLYYLDKIESDIKLLNKELSLVDKKRSSIISKIDNLEWLQTYMKKNKIQREIKDVIKTDMILEALKEEDVDKKSTITEILSIDV